MSPFVSHLVLSSSGLLLVGLVAVLVRRALRSDPVLSYSTLVVVLSGALVLPVLQWLVQGKTTAYQGDVHRLVARVTSAAPDPIGASPFMMRRAAPRVASPTAAVTNVRAEPPRSRMQSWLAANASWEIGAVYLAGACVVLVLQLLRVRTTVRLVALGTPLADGEVLALWRELARNSPLRDRVRLLSLSGLDSPACFGLIRPVLLLPQPQGPRQSLEWALRHELVHLERRDSHVSVLQSLVTIVFWFHPVAWWLAREVGALRELSCDALVVAKNGHRKSYALALLDYASQPCHPTSLSLAPQLLHWSRSRSQLRRRIEMLAHSKCVTGALPRLMRRLVAAIPLSALWGVQLAAAATFLPSDSVAPASMEDRTPKREKALAITTEKVNDELAAQLDVDSSQVLLVTDVDARGPAGRAGIARFDVIIQIDGRQPATRSRLHQATERHASDGSELALRVMRKGAAVDVAIALGCDEMSDGAGAEVSPKLRERLKGLGYLAPSRAKKAARLGQGSDEQALEQHIERLGKQLEESLGPALEQLGPELERALEPHLKKLGVQLEQEIAPQLEGLGEDLNRILESHLEQLGPELERALQPRLQALQAQLEDLGPQLETLGPELQRVIGPKLQELGPKLEQGLKPLQNLGPMIQKMLQNIGPAVQQAVREGEVDQGEIDAAVKAALEQVERAVKSLDDGKVKAKGKAKAPKQSKSAGAVRFM